VIYKRRERKIINFVAAIVSGHPLPSRSRLDSWLLKIKTAPLGGGMQKGGS